jgi:hypothetical protein
MSAGRSKTFRTSSGGAASDGGAVAVSRKADEEFEFPPTAIGRHSVILQAISFNDAFLRQREKETKTCDYSNIT